MIDNAEDLDIVISIFNLIVQSGNYSMASGSLWIYYGDEIDDIDDDASQGKSFKNKKKITGKTEK